MAGLDRRNSFAQCVYSGQPINIKDVLVGLRKRHLSVWPTEDQAEHDGHPNKLAKYHNWVALAFRHISAFGKPLCHARSASFTKAHAAEHFMLQIALSQVCVRGVCFAALQSVKLENRCCRLRVQFCWKDAADLECNCVNSVGHEVLSFNLQQGG
eukprot:1152802-Pelagomonas_calceolata.AAC.2